MKRIFTSIWISLACVAVMILTGALILVFYVVVVFRKMFIKDFTPNALRGQDVEEEETIGSAKAHMNRIQASFEKTEPSQG